MGIQRPGRIGGNMKRIGFVASLLMTLALFISCASNKQPVMNNTFNETNTTDGKNQDGAEEEIVKPLLLTQMPIIAFTGVGIKYECESLLLEETSVVQDESASSKYAIKIENNASRAQIKIRFPAGTYECLLCEKAYSTAQSAFYVYIDDNAYRVYPSNPPTGNFELTTRAPIYFTIDEPRTILVTIQANSGNKIGGTGMFLDYIQFVKRK